MLNETASSRDNQVIVRTPQPPLSKEEILFNELRQMVSMVLVIQKETFQEREPEQPDTEVHWMAGGSRLVATFEGTLLFDSEAAYAKLDDHLVGRDHFAVFRPANPQKGEVSGPHVIHILVGRIEPEPRPWWPNALLFIATLISVLIVGTELAIGEIATTNPLLAAQLGDRFFAELWRGLPYALSILLILGAHELGHYFAARRHDLAVTLPYFIPLPLFSLFGTMGAFIQLRQPMRNRKVLLDVGAAGPLAGLVFAVPILLIGLASTQVIEITGAGFYEGDSILYALAKIVTFGRFLPADGVDVCINCSQLAWAGWTGLLVTALNLIPIGQLDGGHVLYALIGDRARRLFYPVLAIMIGLVFLTDVWLLWVILLLFFGRVYATPLDMITPLDNRRRWVAILALVVFVLIFVPAPMSQVLAPQPGTGTPNPRDSAALLTLVAPALVLALARLRR